MKEFAEESAVKVIEEGIDVGGGSPDKPGVDGVINRAHGLGGAAAFAVGKTVPGEASVEERLEEGMEQSEHDAIFGLYKGDGPGFLGMVWFGDKE